ncbi:reverse transcriptase domain-containing protein [Tanacetum coccineum]
MSVRLADRSFQYPVGIAENMLVEVGKFTFPANFVILEMEEDSKVLLILGRPFLHTADVVIRVKQKQLNLGVRNERMIFNIDSAMKHSYSNDDTCFSIDVINEILEEDFDALLDEGIKILHSIEGTLLEEEIFFEFDEFMAMTADENSESESDTEEPPFEKITINTEYKIKTSLEEPPTDLKLKPLPDNLEYVFLEEPSFLLLIISSKLSAQNKSKLLGSSLSLLVLEPLSDRGLKKKRLSKDAEPTTSPKKNDSTSGSSKGTKSQPKSSRKFVQSEEPVFEVVDSNMPQDQEGNLGDNEDETRNETASRRDWFKKPTPPQEPTDPDWYVGETIQEGPTRNWLMTLAASTSTDKLLKDFDELMSTLIDFSGYILNGLKIKNLTQEILLGPAFKLLKGTRSNFAELEYVFEECYKALSEKLDWENPEGGDYPFDLYKPLPLITRGKHQ